MSKRALTSVSKNQNVYCSLGLGWIVDQKVYNLKAGCREVRSGR